MLTCLLLQLSLAHADVAIPPPDDKQFIAHDLVVEGLDAHPDAVLLVLDSGESVSTYRAFRTGGETRKTLAQGGRSRGGSMSAPLVKILPRAAFEA